MRKLFIAFALLCVFNGVYAQTNEKKSLKQDFENLPLRFSELKIIDNDYEVVYFCIDKIQNENQKNKILSDIEKQEYVKSARIYTDKYGYIRCQAYILQTTTPEMIQKVLLANNTNFLFFSVKHDKN